MTEAEFQLQVTDLAELCGWQWVHFRPAQTAKGWRTPVSGPLGKGWVDLVLVRARDKRLIFAELKAEKGRVTAEQAATLAVLGELTQVVSFGTVVETYIWRPVDFETRFDRRSIPEILR